MMDFSYLTNNQPTLDMDQGIGTDLTRQAVASGRHGDLGRYALDVTASGMMQGLLGAYTKYLVTSSLTDKGGLKDAAYINKKYAGTGYAVDRPMYESAAAMDYNLWSQTQEQERRTHLYNGNRTLGALVGASAFVLGGGISDAPLILATEGLGLVWRLFGMTSRLGSAIKPVGRLLSKLDDLGVAGKATRFTTAAVVNDGLISEGLSTGYREAVDPSFESNFQDYLGRAAINAGAGVGFHALAKGFEFASEKVALRNATLEAKAARIASGADEVRLENQAMTQLANTGKIDVSKSIESKIVPNDLTVGEALDNAMKQGNIDIHGSSALDEIPITNPRLAEAVEALHHVKGKLDDHVFLENWADELQQKGFTDREIASAMHSLSRTENIPMQNLLEGLNPDQQATIGQTILDDFREDANMMTEKAPPEKPIAKQSSRQVFETEPDLYKKPDAEIKQTELARKQTDETLKTYTLADNEAYTALKTQVQAQAHVEAKARFDQSIVDDYGIAGRKASVLSKLMSEDESIVEAAMRCITGDQV